MRYFSTSAYTAIALSEKGEVPRELQFLRVGKFKHPSYGNFEITAQTLAELKANFDARVRGIDIAFDYSHDSDKEASGWPKSFELRENGTELWAIHIEWTPKAATKLAEKEYKYFSPDFYPRWEDPESGKVYKNVIFGGGLTNRPFVKEMAAIVAAEKPRGDQSMPTIEEVQAQNIKLAEEKSSLATQLSEAKAAQASAEAKTAETEKLLKAEQGKVISLTEEKAKIAKEAEFAVLLKEGKACAAQKDAFIKGDLTEFMKLAEKPNMGGKGSTEGDTSEDFEDKVLKLAEEKCKADPKLDKIAAINQARKEIKQ
jgi:hypothetical protein